MRLDYRDEPDEGPPDPWHRHVAHLVEMMLIMLAIAIIWVAIRDTLGI